MKNYWLDKMSERNSKSEKRLKRLESWSSYGFMVSADHPYRRPAYTCKFEVVHDGKIAIPACAVHFPFKADEHGCLQVKYIDFDNFPMKGYKWIANMYNWCDSNNPVVPDQCPEGAFRLYKYGKCINEKRMPMRLTAINFGYCGDPEFTLVFTPQ